MKLRSIFKIYEVVNGNVVKSEIVPTDDINHLELIGFLSNLGVDDLICSRIDEVTFKLLEVSGIKVYSGEKCDTDIAVDNMLNSRTLYDSLDNSFFR